MKKKVKKIPWWQPQMGKKEFVNIASVLKSNFPNEGPVSEKFEKKLATLLEVPYIVTVPNGTTALFLSLKALGIGYGDEVIVPDLTFIATANACEMTGAKVVLVDVNPESLTIDPESFKKAITKKTRAVIPVHVSGRPADITTICAIAKEHDIAVVEDAAEAFMSKYRNKFLGTYGTTGCFSLSPAKIITTGQGGFIATREKQVYVTLKKLKDQGRPKRGTGGDDIHDTIGYNFKFTDLQAAVGLGQLTYLKKRIIRLKKNNQLYRKYLKNVPQIQLVEGSNQNGILPLWTDVIAQDRNGLTSFLKKSNVDCRNFWMPIHQQKAYLLSDSKFPVSSKYAGSILWLSSAFTLSDSEIKKVSNLIRKYYKHSLIK